MSNRFIITLCALLLPASATLAADYVTNADQIVKEADWEKMVTVTVELEEHTYTPEKLEFKPGQTYKLELVNKGDEKHYFTAPEFYKGIALRKVQTRDGEIKAPYLNAIEVLVGGQVDVYFVPVTSGDFPVFCTIEDHRDKGMDGTISIR